MMRWTMGVAALALALNLAGPAAAKHRKAPECSACHMKLSSKKTDATPTAVKIGKKTYYCCAKCDMSAAKTEGAGEKKPAK